MTETIKVATTRSTCPIACVWSQQTAWSSRAPTRHAGVLQGERAETGQGPATSTRACGCRETAATHTHAQPCRSRESLCGVMRKLLGGRSLTAPSLRDTPLGRDAVLGEIVAERGDRGENSQEQQTKCFRRAGLWLAVSQWHSVRKKRQGRIESAVACCSFRFAPPPQQKRRPCDVISTTELHAQSRALCHSSPGRSSASTLLDGGIQHLIKD